MTRLYSDAAQFEAVFTTMFAGIETEAPEQLDALVKQGMVVRFRVREPEVDLWIDGRSAPVEVAFAPMAVRPDLTGDLTADSMHALLLGTLPLGRAVMFRKLKVSGSTRKAKRLEPLLHAKQATYPAVAANSGIGG